MRTGSTLSGTVMVAAAAVLWGLNGTASRLVLDAGIDPLRLTQARITGAAVVLLVWLLLREPGAVRLRGREWLAYALFGVLGLVGVQWFYFEAIARIPIGIALIIEYIAPLLVALWVRVVWKRRLPLVAWLALPVALVGLGLSLGLGMDGVTALAPLGVAAALTAALAYAYYGIHAESLTRRRSAPAVLGLGLAFGTVALALALPWWRFPFPALAVVPADAPLDVPAIGFLAFVVVFGTLIPFVLLIAGIRRIGADGASVTAMLEPIVAGAVAWIVLGQVLAPIQVAGAVCVLVAVTAAQVARARAGRLSRT